MKSSLGAKQPKQRHALFVCSAVHGILDVYPGHSLLHRVVPRPCSLCSTIVRPLQRPAGAGNWSIARNLVLNPVLSELAIAVRIIAVWHVTIEAAARAAWQTVCGFRQTAADCAPHVGIICSVVQLSICGRKLTRSKE